MRIIIDFSQEFDVVVSNKPNQFRIITNNLLKNKSIKILTIKSDLIKEGLVVITNHPVNEKRSGFKLFEGIVHFKNHKARVMAVNTSEFNINLPKNLNVAREEVENEDMYYEEDNIKDIKIEEIDINQQLNQLQKDQITQIIKEYQQTFQKSNSRVTHTKHKIVLDPNIQPIKQRPYRVPITLESKVEAEIKEMLANQIIKPSESSWASPINLIKKKDGGWRFVVDYRKLNSVTRKDSYLLPRIDDLLTKEG